MREKFIGFYPSRPFWAGERLDIHNPIIIQNFHKLASQIVFDYEKDLFQLRVHKDGMLALKIKNLEVEGRRWEDELPPTPDPLIQWWIQYLDHINCLYLILDSVAFTQQNFVHFNFSEITNRDAFRIQYEDGILVSMVTAYESYVAKHQDLRYSRSPEEIQFMYSSHRAINESIFDEVVQKFDSLVKDNRVLTMLSTIARSLGQYKIGNYSTSFTLAWFVIETDINNKWSLILDKRKKFPDESIRINGDRKKILTEGQDYTISVVLNIMELMDELSFEKYKRLNEVRKIRNKIVHEHLDFKCKSEDCQLALNLALELALENAPFDLVLNLHQSIPSA